MTTKPKRGRRSAALQFLEKRAGGPLTLGRLLEAIRVGDEVTQAEFARMLGISRSHLCDIEHGRKSVSLTRAMKFAKILGYPGDQFVRLALQSMVDEVGLDLQVRIEAA